MAELFIDMLNGYRFMNVHVVVVQQLFIRKEMYVLIVLHGCVQIADGVMYAKNGCATAVVGVMAVVQLHVLIVETIVLIVVQVTIHVLVVETRFIVRAIIVMHVVIVIVVVDVGIIVLVHPLNVRIAVFVKIVAAVKNVCVVVRKFPQAITVMTVHTAIVAEVVEIQVMVVAVQL